MEKIIIFIMPDLIYGLKICSDTNAIECINISGKDFMKYSGKSDIDDFYRYICDNFFISDFSQIDMKITVINSGADKKIKGYLYQKCSDAEYLDILEIESAISFLMPLHNDIKEGKEHIIKYRDSFYAYKDMEVFKTETDKFDIEIKDDFFTQIFNLHDKRRVSLSKKNIQLEEKVAVIEKELKAKK